MLLLTVSRGQEVISELGRQLRERGVANGAVASLIGAVDKCTISNMHAKNAEQDIVTEYEKPFELSGTGEVIDGRLHLHVVLGQQCDAALSGHLHRAEVRNFFVRAYVLPL